MKKLLIGICITLSLCVLITISFLLISSRNKTAQLVEKDFASEEVSYADENKTLFYTSFITFDTKYEKSFEYVINVDNNLFLNIETLSGSIDLSIVSSEGEGIYDKRFTTKTTGEKKIQVAKGRYILHVKLIGKGTVTIKNG